MMLCMQDGSAESFQELLGAIMSPTSLFDFDTNIFQAALVGEVLWWKQPVYKWLHDEHTIV